MRFIEQRVISGVPGAGDCMRACVASILDLAYEDVPDLSPDGTASRGQHWATVDFLRERGLGALDYSPAFREGRSYRLPWEEQDLTGRLDVSGLVLGYAWSPRVRHEDGARGGHCVVLLDGTVIWDPHPRRDMGIGSLYGFLIPVTPDGRHLQPWSWDTGGRVVLCGENAVFPASRMGCGRPVLGGDVYRCTDCATPFHRACLGRHCQDDLARANERIAAMAAADCPNCAGMRVDLDRARAGALANDREANRLFVENQKLLRERAA